MQNRYVGDFGDFIKFALLRALMPGLRVGVAWWLFPDESHNKDGRHTGYLACPSEWRDYDPELFDVLAALVDRGSRHIEALQGAGLLPGAIYADEMIPTGGTPGERRLARAAWFRCTQSALADCDLVFADPDNGLETASFSPGASGSGKCIALAEVKGLSSPNRTLVIYHHNTRRKGGHALEVEHWARRLREAGFSTVDAIRSHRFSTRTFFILNAPLPVRQRARQITSDWGRHLSWHEDTQACTGPAPMML